MGRRKTKKELQYYDDLAKHVFARKSKFFRRNLHLNHKETDIKIIRIKNDQYFYDEVEGFKEPPRNLCFFIYHIDPLLDKAKYYSVNDSDFIITDSTTNRVISINKKLKNYPDFFNVWIVRKNTVNFLKINLNDILFTR